MRRRLAVLAAVAGIGACSSTPSGGASDLAPASTSPGGPAEASPPNGTVDAGKASADAGPEKGPPPSSLPVVFTRPDVGLALTPAELAAATDEVVALLRDTRYFDVVDERVHGWPETSPGFWFGTWWSGITVTKQAGVVTYQHGAGGADNNGLRTAPYLEGACYAHLMWGDALTARLIRRIARGYSSWALAMKRTAGDTAKPMLARAHYGASVTSTESGRTIVIDTSLDRPGEDNGATEYVHLPDNPTFGDIWIKNKRSKDDMGQIFRSIVQVQACVPRLDPAAQADLAQTKALYAAWGDQVERDGWGIATLDKSQNVMMPPVTETLAHYSLIDDIECPGALMMRLLAHGDTGTLACGTGISGTEALLGSQLKGGAKQILRTHHEAAVNAALAFDPSGPALALLQGLASRVETEVGLASQSSPPGNVEPLDIVSLVLHAANTGVPLTSTEIRFVHAHLATAHASYRAAANATTYHLFDATTPDGTYPYDPPGDGMFFSDIGLLLGSCAAPYRNPAGRPLLDCARLLAAFP